MNEMFKRPSFDLRRSPFEMMEPLRRMFEGEMDASSIRVEELVDGNTLIVRAELPGIDPEQDVDISVAEEHLHIHAQRRERKEERGKDRYRSEFRYGSFSRSIQLPKGVRNDDISATYRDGVLEVRAPLPPQTEQEPVRRIHITRE
ncbi:molecular chaperone [Arthrobacter crystallopoietes BAB-32]|uniref:Molecular chaperone n=1 Tax=Arthrobacter crystallopoietes BAB-32 TaxID=1246476 RepID=N1UV10_9MICC|nr:Hsp20/alpha crystallin family protein [Arthrobacter crystallopoietes]EMY32875.1 molecular chaperone [Arthrobacter crystallopoietes BAB-32]